MSMIKLCSLNTQLQRLGSLICAIMQELKPKYGCNVLLEYLKMHCVVIYSVKGLNQKRSISSPQFI